MLSLLFGRSFKVSSGIVSWYRSSSGIDFEIPHTIYQILYLSTIYYKVYTDFDNSEVESPAPGRLLSDSLTAREPFSMPRGQTRIVEP